MLGRLKSLILYGSDFSNAENNEVLCYPLSVHFLFRKSMAARKEKKENDIIDKSLFMLHFVWCWARKEQKKSFTYFATLQIFTINLQTLAVHSTSAWSSIDTFTNWMKVELIKI